ncbi:hypothetical protein PS2_042705 [Malus domestica]
MNDHDGHVNVWVLKEYDVSDSWAKLYTLKINNDNLPYSYVICFQRIFITEKSIVVCSSTSGGGMELIKCERKEEKLVNGMLYKLLHIMRVYFGVNDKPSTAHAMNTSRKPKAERSDRAHALGST